MKLKSLSVYLPSQRMDGPRECHKLSQSGREKEIYMASLLWNLKRNNINELQNRETDRVSPFTVEGRKYKLTYFISLGSRITAASDEAITLNDALPWKESYGKHSVLKNRNITLLLKPIQSKLWLFQ